MGHKDRLPEGKRTAADGPKGDSADSVLPVALGTDLAPIDRLRQHLAFGDTEFAPLRRLCEDRELNGNVVLEMLELEQSLAGMGKRRGTVEHTGLDTRTLLPTGPHHNRRRAAGFHLYDETASVRRSPSDQTVSASVARGQQVSACCGRTTLKFDVRTQMRDERGCRGVPSARHRAATARATGAGAA